MSLNFNGINIGGTNSGGGGGGGTSNHAQLTNLDYANSGHTGFMKNDASNLTTDGQKVFDGQWVGTNNQVYSGDVFQSSTSFDVSSYLPDDNYDYELLVVGYATCTTTNGQTTECDVKGDAMTGGYMACAISTCTNSRAVTDAGFGFIIVGSERKIYFYGSSANTAGTIKLVIKAYRRVGTNL